MTPKESYVLWLLSGKALCIHCNVNPIPQGFYMHCDQCDTTLHHLNGKQCEYFGELLHHQKNRIKK